MVAVIQQGEPCGSGSLVLVVGSGLWSIPARIWEGGSTVDRGGIVSLHVARDTDSGILLTFWKPFRLDPCLVLHSSTARSDISLLTFH